MVQRQSGRLIFLTVSGERAAIAAVLLSAKLETQVEQGKPKFPVLRPDFVGPLSWVFFDHLAMLDRKISTQT